MIIGRTINDTIGASQIVFLLSEKMPAEVTRQESEATSSENALAL